VSPARTKLRALVIAAVTIAIAGTTATAAHAAPSTGDINKKITDSQNQLEDVVESYNKLRISLNKTIADEKALAASLGPAQDALKVASAQMKSIASTAYMNGDVGTVNVLLDGPGDLVDRMSVLDQMSRNRSRDIATYTATTQNYTQRQAALHITQARQAAEVKELAARKAKIEADIKKLRAMKLAATGSATDRSTGGYTGSAPAVSGAAGKAVSYAYAVARRHAPYGYGQDGPGSYDCSGLTMAAWRAAGKSLPHNAAQQYSATARISRSSLRPGDLVFYRSLGHVGLYVGNNQIIDAPHEGAYVNVRSINIMPPYGYGRVR
jgi:cell wall-associated NlpC family hydrolase